MVFRSKFRKARNSAGVTQAEIGKVLGLGSAQFVSNWERGQSLPPLKYVKKLAKAVSMKESDILESMYQTELQRLNEKYSRG